MSELLSLLQKQIDEQLAQKEQIVIAIDGCCAAGKTTFAGQLAQRYDCNVFHMDDFFLQPHQRTPQRYAEIGGNVDYERFREEILTPLEQHRLFSYRPFDCKTLTMGQPVEVIPKKLSIVEGSYSLHRYFGDPYDLKIFMRVESEVQRRRILERPAHLHSRFFEEWIPMEERYFQEMAIAANADLVISY